MDVPTIVLIAIGLAMDAFARAHEPPKIPIQPLIESFEILAEKIMNIELGPRETENRKNLVHPVHQQLTVYEWEVLGHT